MLLEMALQQRLVSVDDVLRMSICLYHVIIVAAYFLLPLRYDPATSIYNFKISPGTIL